MDPNQEQIDQALEQEANRNWDHFEHESSREQEQQVSRIAEQPQLPEIQSSGENIVVHKEENSPVFTHGGNEIHAQPQIQLQSQDQDLNQPQQNFVQNQGLVQTTHQSFQGQLQTRPGLQIHTNKSINSQQSRISSNSREASPNRYFGSGLPVSGSIRTITPPHSSKIVNLNQNSSFQTSRQNIGSIKTVQQSIIRSRVVSEVEGRPILKLPSGVQIIQQQVKPMSTLVERKDHFNVAQAQVNRNRIVSFQNQQVLNTQHNAHIHQNQRPTSTIQAQQVRNINSVREKQPRQVIQIQNQQAQIPHQTQIQVQANQQHSQKQIQNLQQVQNIQSGQNRQILNNVVEGGVKFDQLVTRIVTIQQSSHRVSYLINIMLQGEKDQKKNVFIKNVLQQQNYVNQRLAELHKDINIFGKQLQSHSNSDNPKYNLVSGQINVEELNRIRSEYEEQIRNLTQLVNEKQEKIFENGGSQIDLLREQFKRTLAENKQLQTLINQLNQKNNHLNNKVDLLHSSDMSGGKASIEDELTKTIEGQKVMIKKLQKQLIDIHHDHSDKSMKQENHEQGVRKAQQDKLLTIIESKKAYINELEAQIIRYKTQIKNLKQIIRERQNTYDRKFSLPVIDQKTPQLDHSGKKFSDDSQGLINKLEKNLAQKDEELDKVKQKIFEIQEQFDRTIEEKNDKIKQLLEQRILDNQKAVKMETSNGENSDQSLPSFNEESSKPIQSTSSQRQKLLTKTINSLQEQLNSKVEQNANQIDRLNQILLGKAKELESLKVSLQQKQNIQKQYEQLKNESLKQKQAKTLQAQQLLRQENTQVGQQQLNIMRDTLIKKESEIVKLRQTIQLHLTNIQQLQNQVDQFGQQNKTMELGIIQQRKNNNQKFSHQENKIKQIQLASLSDKDRKSHDSEVSKLKSTIKELKKKLKDSDEHHSHQNSGEKIGDLVDEEDLRQQYGPSQIKIFQLEAIVKNKENKIKQLETNLESMKVKINHTNVNEEDLISQQQIEMLQKKLAQYEAKLSYNAQSLMKTYQMRDYDSVHVFEQKIIYDLKAENERLKLVLGGGKTSKSGKQDNAYNVGVQKRLQQFNSKLQEMIVENQQLERTGAFPSQNKDLVSIFERQKSILFKKHHKEIQNFQARMIDLQRYCSALQQGSGQSTYTYTHKKQNTHMNENSSVLADQISYYKQKNKQLEDRVDNLIGLNKQLKSKLEQLLKPSGQHNLEYYKQQAVLMEQKVVDLELRLSSLIEENASLKQQLSSARSDFSIQHQLTELTQKNQTQNLVIIQLQQEKSYLQDNLQSLTKQIKYNSTDLLNQNTLLLSKQGEISNLQQQIRKLTNQNSQYQYEITRLNNRIEIIKGQNERLLEQTKENDQNKRGEYESLLARLNQIQQELREYKNKEQAWESEKFEYTQTIKSLKVKLTNLDQASKSEVDQQNLLAQRLKDFQCQLSLLQTQNYSLTQTNQSLTQQIINFQSQLEKALSSESLNVQIIAQLRYQLQYIRSIFIELEALCSQIVVGDEGQQKGVISQMRNQIGNGLRGCETIVV